MTMPDRRAGRQRGIIAWFAGNHVAANLLMLSILFAGRCLAVHDPQADNTGFRTEHDRRASAVSRCRAPGSRRRRGHQDRRGRTGRSGHRQRCAVSQREGLGSVTIKVSQDADVLEVLNEVKTRVDAISTFPALTEKPVIYKQEVPVHVVFLAIHGDLDAFARKAIAQEVREDLMAFPEVTQVQYLGDRRLRD